jgi:prepilin-type N-terminal cleavage/methylation domain-containing protein
LTSLKRIAVSSAGFTLPELLIATIISLALGIGGFLFIRSQIRSLTDQSAGLDAIEGARAALDFMVNEIRTAGEKPTLACGSCGLTAATASGLSISFDANGNGNATDSGEQIGYLYNSGSKLVLRCTGATCSNGSTGTTLIRNASGLSFSYTLDDGTTTTTPTAAQLSHVVRVAVTVQVDAAKATTVTTVTLTSNVTIRNQATVLANLGAS